MEKFFEILKRMSYFFSVRQWYRVNALTIMAFCTFMVLTPNAGYSQDKKISLNLKNVSIKQALEEVKAKTNYSIWYNVNDLDAQRKVSVSTKDQNISEILQTILDGQNVRIEVKDKRILIIKNSANRNQGGESSKNGSKGKKVVGKVLDENGQPLPGASVVLKGANIGAMCDANGQFSIEIPNEDVDLSVSFLGYKTILVPAQFASTIRMISNAVSMDAVVVTGYQTISKERATGSYNIVNKAILEKPATSLATQLIGSSSGLQANIDSKGEATSFTIRGRSSVGYGGTNSKPLVVVDGFPIQGDFNSINPNDVESVCILKDAASASIWGARAANGVIVVTSKHARKGSPLNVDFSTFVKIGSKYDLDYSLNKPSSAATIDWEQYAFGKWGERKIASSNSSSNLTDARTPVVTLLNEYRLGKITAQERDAEINRLKSLNNQDQIRKYVLQRPISQQYNLTISGSTDRMNNSLSLLYNTSRPSFQGNSNKSYMLNYHNTAVLARWIDFDLNTMVQYSEAQTGGFSAGDISSLAPYEMLVNEDGTLNNINTRYYMPNIKRYVPTASFPYSNWNYNPIEEAANRSLLEKNLNTRIQAGLNIKLLKGLVYSTKAQFELFNSWDKELQGENTFEVRRYVNENSAWNKATGEITPNLPKGAFLKQKRDESRSYNFRNQLDYNCTFDEKHSITLLAGTEISQTISEGFSYSDTYGFDPETLSASEFPNGPGYPTEIYGWQGWTQQFSYTNYFSYNTTRNFSMYGNASYTYDHKYNVSGSYRTDASNFIAEDPKYRYSPFWSVGASWNIDEEQFVKSIKWIDRLSVRATFGYNGNASTNSSYKPLIAVGNRDAKTGDLSVWVISKGNPTQRWEKTANTNFGLDYSLFQGKLYGNINVYSKHGRDILARVSMASVNGSESESMNNAEILNQGIEFEVGTSQSLATDLTWNGNLNFSYNRNEMKKLYINSYTPSDLAGGYDIEGYDMSSIWVYRYAGMNNIGTATSPNIQPTVYGPNDKLLSVSDYYGNLNGLEMMKYAGRSTAPYTLGMTNSFGYKGINLSFVVTGLFGHKTILPGFNYPLTSYRGLPNNFLSDVFSDGKPLRNIDVIELPYSNTDPNYSNWKKGSLDYNVRDAWNIRMQSIDLSYNLPKSILSKINIGGISLSAQVNNIFTIKGTKDDPEFQRGSQRLMPSYSFGVKVHLN